MCTILFPEMLNHFKETLMVTEMHAYKNMSLFLLGEGKGGECLFVG